MSLPLVVTSPDALLSTMPPLNTSILLPVTLALPKLLPPTPTTKSVIWFPLTVAELVPLTSTPVPLPGDAAVMMLFKTLSVTPPISTPVSAVILKPSIVIVPLEAVIWMPTPLAGSMNDSVPRGPFHAMPALAPSSVKGLSITTFSAYGVALP